MRALSLMLATALAFGLLPFSGRVGLLLGAALAVGSGVLLALAASYTPSAAAVAAGALGALATGVLAEFGPTLAGALLVGAAFAERTLRVRERADARLHVALALGVGAIAGYLSSRYSNAEPWVMGVVVVIAAVLATAPLLIPADDALAHGLDQLADELEDPVRQTLRAGAELRRSVDDTLLDADSARDARRAWRNLLRLGHARVRLTRAGKSAAAGAVVARLDQRLTEYVTSLTGMYTAVDTVAAATLSLDDDVISSMTDKGATLDDVSSAIIEEVA